MRQQLHQRSQGLETPECPFANLPEARAGRWGDGLTAAKMKDCRWLLCRIRHSSHNVECRTMPNRLLPLLSFLRSASFRFGIIRLRIRQRNRAPFAHVSKRYPTRQEFRSRQYDSSTLGRQKLNVLNKLL